MKFLESSMPSEHNEISDLCELTLNGPPLDGKFDELRVFFVVYSVAGTHLYTMVLILQRLYKCMLYNCLEWYK